MGVLGYGYDGGGRDGVLEILYAMPYGSHAMARACTTCGLRSLLCRSQYTCSRSGRPGGAPLNRLYHTVCRANRT